MSVTYSGWISRPQASYIQLGNNGETCEDMWTTHKAERCTCSWNDVQPSCMTQVDVDHRR
jgi:hypothetical protein